MNSWRERLGLGVLAAAVVCLGGAGCGVTVKSAATVAITPSVGLMDQARAIVISHLSPGETVVVSARSLRPSGVWTARATFKADGSGFVDIAGEAPLSGSYRGVSPMGLLWSEHLSGSGSAPLNGVTVTTLTVSAANRRPATARLTQVLDGPGVTEHSERIAQAGFFGEFFAPPGLVRRRPAVVVWGGSEGALGDGPSEAALLASDGIPALALAYFDEPGLPCSLSDVPLEYFVRAIRWLRSRPDVNPNRVWILSGSRGTEAELLVAAHWPGLVHGIVAEAASSIAYGSIRGSCLPSAGAAWTLHGRAVPYDAPTAGAAMTENPDGSMSEVGSLEAGLAQPSAAAAAIPVRNITASVMLVSGGDDQLWPSAVYAKRIMAGLRSDRAPHFHLNYPAAGHVVLDIPYGPPITKAQEPTFVLDLGGTPTADEAAYESDWPAMIRFISR